MCESIETKQEMKQVEEQYDPLWMDCTDAWMQGDRKVIDRKYSDSTGIEECLCVK